MVSSYRYDIESKIKFATAYAAFARSCHFVRQGGNVLTFDLAQLFHEDRASLSRELHKLCNLNRNA